MSIFGNFFSKFFGTPQEDSPASPNDSAAELQRAWDHVQALARDQISSPGPSRQASSMEDHRLQHQVARGALWETILACHRELETGLDVPDVLRLARMAQAHALDAEEPATSGLAVRIDRFVLSGLFSRCASRAWDRLVFLMERSGTDWPVPPDFHHRRSAEEVAALMVRHRNSVRLEFLSASMAKQVDLVTGEIQIWGPTYPSTDSWVWRQTALLAVGAALQLQLFGAALELWLWRSPGLEEALRAQVQTELAAAKELLRRGVVTLEDAENVASRSRFVCGQVIPELVWSYLAPYLRWEGDALKVATLEPGLSIVDPVCAMALTSERIAARVSLQGKTYYFCSERCKSRFQEHPERFSLGANAGQPLPARKTL